jgi:hypothetical protein
MESNKKWWRDRLRMQFGFDIWRLPVCERCEGYALWNKDSEGNAVGTCQCGYTTKNPITVEEYYTKGHHVDRTIHNDAPVFVDRQIALPKQVATVEDQKIIIARC